ncbi:MAG: ABC transporter permease [Candidatus Thorarchaeota archaeon]
MSMELIGSSIVTAATFFLIPTLGEILTERSGVLNLGVEGMVISSAAGAFAVTYLTGNAMIGVLAGMAVGGILALIHAILSITFNRNQVVSGISLTIFGTGLSGLLGRDFVGRTIAALQPIPIPGLSAIPFFGPVFFNKDILVYASFILVPVLWFILFRTRIGIVIRTVGENPAAAYTQGINVILVRYLCVILGGMLCGLGGAYMTVAWMPAWTEGMTGGRGWIVIALTVVALWHPITAFLGAYLFGIFHVLQFSFQLSGIPVAFINMLPYLSTIAFLVAWGILLNKQKVKRIIGAPSALCVPFEKG